MFQNTFNICKLKKKKKKKKKKLVKTSTFNVDVFNGKIHNFNSQGEGMWDTNMFKR